MGLLYCYLNMEWKASIQYIKVIIGEVVLTIDINSF